MVMSGRFTAFLSALMIISTSACAAEPSGGSVRTIYFPQPAAVETRIGSALRERTDLAFSDTPLTEALGFLKDYHQIPIWIDQRALLQSNIKSDVPLTLEISGITLRSGLRLMLEPLGLTYMVEDEVLKVTSVEYAYSHQHSRVYPVGDLADSQDELKSLADAIEKGIIAAKWAKPDSNLGGTISPVFGTRALVVRQTYQSHEKVVELLDSLRAAKDAQRVESAGTR